MLWQTVNKQLFSLSPSSVNCQIFAMSVNIFIPLIDAGFMMDSGSSTPLLLILPLLHYLINVLFLDWKKCCCSFFHWACETATPSGRCEYLCWRCMVFALMWRRSLLAFKAALAARSPEAQCCTGWKSSILRSCDHHIIPSYSAPRKQATSPKCTCDVQHGATWGITWQWSWIFKLKGKRKKDWNIGDDVPSAIFYRLAREQTHRSAIIFTHSSTPI